MKGPRARRSYFLQNEPSLTGDRDRRRSTDHRALCLQEALMARLRTTTANYARNSCLIRSASSSEENSSVRSTPPATGWALNRGDGILCSSRACQIVASTSSASDQVSRFLLMTRMVKFHPQCSPGAIPVLKTACRPFENEGSCAAGHQRMSVLHGSLFSHKFILRPDPGSFSGARPFGVTAAPGRKGPEFRL
jgi:hypothetical protein